MCGRVWIVAECPASWILPLHAVLCRRGLLESSLTSSGFASSLSLLPNLSPNKKSQAFDDEVCNISRALRIKVGYFCHCSSWRGAPQFTLLPFDCQEGRVSSETLARGNLSCSRPPRWALSHYTLLHLPKQSTLPSHTN